MLRECSHSVLFVCYADSFRLAIFLYLLFSLATPFATQHGLLLERNMQQSDVGELMMEWRSTLVKGEGKYSSVWRC